MAGETQREGHWVLQDAVDRVEALMYPINDVVERRHETGPLSRPMYVVEVLEYAHRLHKSDKDFLGLQPRLMCLKFRFLCPW